MAHIDTPPENDVKSLHVTALRSRVYGAGGAEQGFSGGSLPCATGHQNHVDCGKFEYNFFDAISQMTSKIKYVFIYIYIFIFYH